MKIVVLAGGQGSRLWPLSRLRTPKQIKPFFGQHTLLQKTIQRLRRGFAYADIYIVTGKSYARLVRAQLPDFPKANILIEPDRRNTAAAIGLAAWHIGKRSPRETIVSIASDHSIAPENRFLQGIKNIERIIKADPKAVCLLGVTPTYPETGYGYIECGKRVKLAKTIPAYEVKQFIEKPPLEKAKKLLQSGRYLWNPSYFGWRVDRLQELYRQFIPRTARLLDQTMAGDKKAFRKIAPEAVDYGIMEKLHEHFYVLPANFAWADVGHWESVRQIQAGKRGDNATHGLHQAVDTKGSLIYNYTESLVAAVGVENLLIVQTKSGTLICHKDRSQDVKKLVEAMQKHKDLRRFV